MTLLDLFETTPVGGIREQIARNLYSSATAKARSESAHVVEWEKAAPYFRAQLLRRAEDLLEAFDITPRDGWGQS